MQQESPLIATQVLVKQRDEMIQETMYKINTWESYIRAFLTKNQRYSIKVINIIDQYNTRYVYIYIDIVVTLIR